MKKLFPIVLALILTLSMSTAAFAAEDDSTWNVEYTETAETTFKEIEKTYTSENDVVVNETLSFTSTARTSNPDGGKTNLTVADLVVSSLNPGTLSVTIPPLKKAGIYEWTIKETAGNTAGVTYSNAEVHVIVLVEYDNTNHTLKIAKTTSYIKQENGEKAKTFENKFNSGSFTVAKDVEGNMANENDEFGITVTLTSTQPIGTPFSFAGTTVNPSDWTAVKDDEGNVTGYTYSKSLQYSEIAGKKTFSNIPVGVVVTVAEDDINTETQAVGTTGYTYESTTGLTDGKLTIVDDTKEVEIVVKNTKGATIDTGLTLDSMPYVLLLAVACVGLFMFFAKKRMMREN